MSRTKTSRIWQFDFLRGLAIVGMLIFHFFYLLDFLDIREYQLFQGSWDLFANLVRCTFIILVGVSLSLAQNKRLGKILYRCLQISLSALTITIVTYLYTPDQYVRFGILHLIATGILISLAFRKTKYLSLILGLLIILLSPYLPVKETTASLDYFPIFPWAGLIFLGISFSNIFIFPRRGELSAKPPGWSKGIIYLGQHSLLVYMLHIPFLLLILKTIF